MLSLEQVTSDNTVTTSNGCSKVMLLFAPFYLSFIFLVLCIICFIFIELRKKDLQGKQ